eukprot:13776043-Alexandrium_andersonii.AAC.1
MARSARPRRDSVAPRHRPMMHERLSDRGAILQLLGAIFWKGSPSTLRTSTARPPTYPSWCSKVARKGIPN